MLQHTDIAEGSRLKLTRPVSELEKQLSRSKWTDFVFVSWTNHGHAKVRDIDVGAIWHLNPEALSLDEQ